MFGRGFESLRLHHQFKKTDLFGFFYALIFRRDKNPERVRTFLLIGYMLGLWERKIHPAPLDDQKPGRRLSEIKKPSPERLGFFMQRRMPERSEAGF